MKIICYLLVFGLCIVGVACDHKRSEDKALTQALQTGDTTYLSSFLASGGDVDQFVEYQPFERVRVPLLFVAVEYGQTNAVQFLLRHGANPNIFGPRGDTAVLWCVSQSQIAVPVTTRLDILQMLLDARGDTNLHDPDSDWTPLIAAAEYREPQMVRILLSGGAQVNATNRVGLTALSYAASPEIAKILLEAGADCKSHGGETPTESALRRGRLDVLKVLTNVAPQTKP